MIIRSTRCRSYVTYAWAKNLGFGEERMRGGFGCGIRRREHLSRIDIYRVRWIPLRRIIFIVCLWTLPVICGSVRMRGWINTTSEPGDLIISRYRMAYREISYEESVKVSRASCLSARIKGWVAWIYKTGISLIIRRQTVYYRMSLWVALAVSANRVNLYLAVMRGSFLLIPFS